MTLREIVVYLVDNTLEILATENKHSKEERLHALEELIKRKVKVWALEMVGEDYKYTSDDGYHYGYDNAKQEIRRQIEESTK